MRKLDTLGKHREGGAQRFQFFLEGSEDEGQTITLSQMVDLPHRSDQEIPHEKLTALACRIYEARRTRAKFLSDSMFGEPVWDMMLALYCLSSQAKALSVSGLCHAAGVPQTTALRWSQLMEQKRLIERTRDSEDARRAYVSLSELGHRLMSDYLATIYHKLTPS